MLNSQCKQPTHVFHWRPNPRWKEVIKQGTETDTGIVEHLLEADKNHDCKNCCEV